LKEFLNQTSSYLLNTIRDQIVNQIVSNITTRFLDLASEVLKNAQQSEEVLKKLVKKPQTSRMGTDLEKIYLQLFLDVQQFGSEISQLNVDISKLHPFQKLLETVSPGKKVYLQWSILPFSS